MIISTQILFQSPVVLADSRPMPAIVAPAAPSQQLDQSHVATRAGDNIPAVVTNPHAGLSVLGTVFKFGGRRRANTRTLNVSRKFPSQTVPDLDTLGFFTNSLNVEVHRAFVILNKLTFVVYGYQDPRYAKNKAIAKFKGTTLWRGEVAVFLIGKRKMFPGPKNVSAMTVNRVAALFVSRATEALDFGVDVSFMIESTFT